MEPSPPAPVPIYGGGHSAPALRRAATLCDGWIAAGAYWLEEAEHHLAELHRARRRAGREHEPFAVLLSLQEKPDLDLYRRLEERWGVTDFLCGPALAAQVEPGATAERQLRARLDASARFAERVVSRAG
jgi:alkanesulfonate monooxygenase SsuD/methylene tetrahydromethanopterin reductase-like flavin-dependent oxidoreductase (luciferase family)